jgi:predicted negative regulator of RcsB-dependent stress response
MKRVIKKQLKGDEFVSTLTKIFHFVQKRSKEIIIAAAAVAFIALLYAGLRLIQANNVRKESRMVTRLLDLRSDLNTKPENLAEMEKLAGKGKFSRLAYVLIATHWVEQGDMEKAKAALAEVGDGAKDFIHYQAQDLLAQILSREKEYDKAIAIYDQIFKDDPNDYSLDVVLFHKAEALEAKGETKEAVAVYKKIQEDFPQSYYGYDASGKVRKLESGL